MKQLSIIIPFHNDVDTLLGTINSIYDTIDIDNFEIVVINDGSSVDVKKAVDYFKTVPNIRYAEHFVNLGVGQAFDTGVRIAESDNLIIMGSDIRFDNNGWASRMISVVDKQPTSIICTACGSTTTNTVYYGADIMFLVNNDDITERHPRKHIKEYRSILEGKWRQRTGRGVYAVPSIMGAFYGVKKAWYKKVRGFELHYKWGVLEPYISLKTWLLGGSILVDTDNITYHIFNRSPQRHTDWNALAYNQCMVANVVFGKFGKKYVQYLSESNTTAYNNGSEMMMEKMESIAQLTNYLNDHNVATPAQLEEAMIELSIHYKKRGCTYKHPSSL